MSEHDPSSIPPPPPAEDEIEFGAREEIELLTSWDAFRAPSAGAKDAGAKDVPNLEGNAMDGTQEVEEENELDLDLD